MLETTPNPNPMAQLQTITPETATRNMRIITLALAGGVLLFACIVVFLSMTTADPNALGTGFTPDPAPETNSMLPMLSWVHLFAFVAAVFFAVVVGGMIESKQFDTFKSKMDSPESAAYSAIQAGHIVKLAVLEGAALLGVVVCLLAAVSGQLREQPFYWINLTSAGLFILYALATLPTKEQVAERARRLLNG